MRLVILSKHDALAYFDQSYHIDKMSATEQKARGANPGHIVHHYKQQLVEPTPDHHRILHRYVQMMEPYLHQFARKLAAYHPQYKVILVKANTEWDYPFTLAKQSNPTDGAVVLSLKVFRDAQRALYQRNSAMIKHFLTILVHELIHLDQKRDSTMYQFVYQQMGFQFLPVTLSPVVQNAILTNPDGSQPNGQWVISLRLQGNTTAWFMPSMMLLGGQHRSMLIELSKDGLTGNLSADSLKLVPIEGSLYQRRFGLAANELTHPNELVAYMLSEYVIQSHRYETGSFTHHYQLMLSLLN